MLSIFKTSEIKQKYSIEEVLGTGTFGEVRLGINLETKEKVAIKIIEPKDTNDEVSVRREIDILAKFHHPNIIGLIEIFEQSSAMRKKKKMFLVMELVTGGELFDRIVKKQHFRESEARTVIKKVLEVLEYMHENGVVHRDLKPENILYATPAEDSPIKIADFGLAKLYDPNLSSDGLHTMCGTPGYVAPEILKRDKSKGYGAAVDMWSTGVIMYILLCGYPPFYDEVQEKLFRQIVKGKYEFPSPEWDEVSKEAIDLIKSLLQTDPNLRLSPAQALRHPWMNADTGKIDSHVIETTNLKKYIRQQKFKRVKNVIFAIGRLQMALKSSLQHQ
jgi:serine/threonine protein kinase